MQTRDTTNAHSLPLFYWFLSSVFFSLPTAYLWVSCVCILWYEDHWWGTIFHHLPVCSGFHVVTRWSPWPYLFWGGGTAIINASEPGIRGCLILSDSSCFNRSHKCPWKEYSHQPWNEIFGKKEIPKPSHKTLDSLCAMQVISIILTQYSKNKMVVHRDDTKPRNNCLTKKFYMLPYAQHITHTQ